MDSDQLEEVITVLQDVRRKILSLAERVATMERGGGGGGGTGYKPTITQMQSSLVEKTKERDQLLIQRKTIGVNWSKENQTKLDEVNRDIVKKRKYIADYPTQ